MLQNFTDDLSTLVQVMVRRRQVTWADVDPDLSHHMASLGHNELIPIWVVYFDYHNVYKYC